MITSCPVNSHKRIPPIVAFFGTFSLVMTILFLTTDLKARKTHRKNLPFKPNSDLTSVQQDNPQLIDFIRHNFINPPGTLAESNTQQVTLTTHQDGRTMTENWRLNRVGALFRNKTDGVFVDVGAYGDNNFSMTEYLEDALNWSGLLIQPDPVIYNNLLLRKRSQSFSANTCVSPTQYPREVSFKNPREESKTQTTVEYKRVFCFPLYSLLLAYNSTKIDLMCINAHGFEFQVLRTLPWPKIDITALSIACNKQDRIVWKKLTYLLESQSYKLMTDFSNENYQVFLKISK
nr:PREDICTED: protein Star [Bemisia tabaci]